MININKFIDKVSATEHKRSNNLVLNIDEAKGLRDEILKLLSDNYDLLNKKQDSLDNALIQVEINGGKW